jgi:hypothetical protein
VRTALFIRLGRAFAIVAVTTLATLGTRASATAAPRLLQLSSDPYTNTIPQQTAQHATEVEPDSYAFGSTIVAAVQAGRFFDGGASNIGFVTSTDGGRSWTNGFLPGTTLYATPGGHYARVSDPSVAFDAKHNAWLISYLGVAPIINQSPVVGELDVLVSRSTDAGLTWGTPVVVNASGDGNDKNWTVCDNAATSPFYGNCYTEFDDITRTDLIQMSTSTDGGLSWGTAQTTANHAHGTGGQPLVQPSGRVIVPIDVDGSRAGFLDAFTSSDGGTSWSNASHITLNRFAPIPGNLRASSFASAAIDAAGTVYVAWPDCRFEVKCAANDIVFSTSSDGVTWTAPTRVPADPVGNEVDHFLPGLAVDTTTLGNQAHLALAYYFYPSANCTTTTCQLDVGFISSVNGGATWSASQQLAGPISLMWLSNTTEGRMVGDYISTSFSGGVAYPLLVSANAPSGDIFDEALFTVARGFSVTGGTNRSNHDVVLVAPGAAPDYAWPLTHQ